MAITVPLTSSNWTVAPAKAVPIRLGLASSVMPSPFVPLSAAGSSAGAPGVVGAATIVNANDALRLLTSPY